MVFDLRLKKNFKIFLSGPSGCGKTTFISDLITNLDCISVDPPKKGKGVFWPGKPKTKVQEVKNPYSRNLFNMYEFKD